MDGQKLHEFKQELRALLKKYDVGIGGSFDGDSHGIHDEKFVVYSIHDGQEHTLTDSTTFLESEDLGGES